MQQRQLEPASGFASALDWMRAEAVGTACAIVLGAAHQDHPSTEDAPDTDRDE